MICDRIACALAGIAIIYQASFRNFEQNQAVIGILPETWGFF